MAKKTIKMRKMRKSVKRKNKNTSRKIHKTRRKVSRRNVSRRKYNRKRTNNRLKMRGGAQDQPSPGQSYNRVLTEEEQAALHNQSASKPVYGNWGDW